LTDIRGTHRRDYDIVMHHYFKLGLLGSLDKSSKTSATVKTTFTWII
jgi:hypothetical protein